MTSETEMRAGFRQQLSTTLREGWSIWAGDHEELSCARFNGEWQFHAKSHVLIVAFWLVLLTEHMVLSCYATNAVYRCLVFGQLYLSCGFSSADCRCFQVSSSCLPNHSTVFILLWQMEICNQNRMFLWNFYDLFNFYWYLGLDSFPR